MKLFRNLILLSKATEAEVKKQAKYRVEETINKEDIVRDIKNEFKEDYRKARSQVIILQGWAFIILALGTSLIFFAGPLLPDIFSLDVLKSNIEDLKEDIKDIRKEYLKKPVTLP